jgi:hypothetical protein
LSQENQHHFKNMPTNENIKNKNQKHAQETLLTIRRKLKEQIAILIVSSEDYLTQINKCVRELKIISRKEVER